MHSTKTKNLFVTYQDNTVLNQELTTALKRYINGDYIVKHIGNKKYFFIYNPESKFTLRIRNNIDVVTLAAQESEILSKVMLEPMFGGIVR